MMKTIEMTIECKDCNGTGVYVGMAERDGAAVVCKTCGGTGAYLYKFNYNKFSGRKKREDVKRVYKSSCGYVIGTGVINFEGTEVDMDKEGVSYDEFLSGKTPEHIESLVCPMSADQRACHSIKNFVDRCHDLNGGYLSLITSCKNQINRSGCWKLFKKEIKEEL